MAFVRVEQRNAHLAGTVRLDCVNGRDGKIARASLTAISNTRRGSGEQREEEATAIQWTLWGKQAENAAEYLGKGSHVNIVGRLRNNNYQDADGADVYGLSFTVDEIDYLDSKADAAGAARAARRFDRRDGRSRRPAAPAASRARRQPAHRQGLSPHRAGATPPERPSPSGRHHPIEGIHHVRHTHPGHPLCQQHPRAAQRRPLSEDQMRQAAPSIFADGKHASRSERYTYIPTIDVLRGLRREGFEPFMVAQGAQPHRRQDASTPST